MINALEVEFGNDGAAASSLKAHVAVSAHKPQGSRAALHNVVIESEVRDGKLLLGADVGAVKDWTGVSWRSIRGELVNGHEHVLELEGIPLPPSRCAEADFAQACNKDDGFMKVYLGETTKTCALERGYEELVSDPHGVLKDLAAASCLPHKAQFVSHDFGSARNRNDCLEDHFIKTWKLYPHDKQRVEGANGYPQVTNDQIFGMNRRSGEETWCTTFFFLQL